MFDYRRLRAYLDLDLAAYKDEPLTSDMSLADVRACMLRRSFYKKLLPSGNLSPDQITAATGKFLRSNELSGQIREFKPETLVESYWYDYFRDHIDRALNACEANYSLDSLREGFAVGPGAAIGADSESFYTKLFGSQLTATSEYLLTLYRGLLSESDTWAHAEMQRFQEFGFREVSGNRLFFVPKDEATARTCCTEPSLNMILQKALGKVFEDRLAECFGIHLSTQPDNNRRLAKLGSETGDFATIDLEAASDSMVWALMQTWLRGRALACVRLFRSPTTQLTDGSELELKMVSTMGNGFTFPLMTIILCCAVRATYDIMGHRSDASKLDYAVFGDDIIVRSDTYHFLITMLGKIGFRANTSKSFAVGPFRESCGADYFNGHNVRGVYIRSLETRASVYSAINRLHRWSALSGIPLTRTCKFLVQSLNGSVLQVPISEALDAGLHTYAVHAKPEYKDGWAQYRALQPMLRTRGLPSSKDESLSMQYSFYSEYGRALTYLGGYARTSEVGIQAKDVDPDGWVRRPPPSSVVLNIRGEADRLRYKVRRKSTPYWDWPGGHTCPYRQAGMSDASLVSCITATLE